MGCDIMMRVFFIECRLPLAPLAYVQIVQGQGKGIMPAKFG